jgi:hypothetical protein
MACLEVNDFLFCFHFPLPGRPRRFARDVQYMLEQIARYEGVSLETVSADFSRAIACAGEAPG